jgi:serine/threonine-protein kinase
MIRFKSFGNIDLRGADGELRNILTQPKRLALLLRLAAERPGTFLRRDTLLAMFWPELDTAGARNALRQALFHLRRELGEGVLLNRGDEEVGLDPAQFRSDVADFEEAAATGRWQVALDLFQGELAPGLYVSEAEGFEEWLEEKRRDIRRRAAAGAWALSRDAEAEDRAGEAAAWARRAVVQAPDDEVGVRRLLQLLVAAGDAAGAVQVYAALEERLRREFGVAPSAETVAIRQAIVAEAPVVSAFPVAGGAAGAVRHEPPSLAVPRIRSWQWLLAGGAIVLVLAATVAKWRGREPGEGATDPARLLIAPFRTSGPDTVLASLSIGLVDLTNARLSGASRPRPVDPDVALRAVDQAKASDTTSATGPLLAAARRTGAGLVLSGTLLREGTRLVLAPVIIRTASGASAQLRQVSGPMDSLPWMVDRMVADLLSALASEDGADAPSLSSIPLPALRAYLDGREAMRDGRVTDAITGLARALELDSMFALAARDYAEAADWAGEDPQGAAKQRAWGLRERLGVRDRAILTALVGRRWPSLTPVREQVEDWEAAIRWAPDRSRTWFGLGDVLFHSGGVAGIAGAQDRSRNAFDRALALDSSSVPALLHRIEMAAREGDTTLVRRLMPLVERGAAPSDALAFLRWRAAVALGDSTALRETLAAFDSMSPFALVRIVGWGQLDYVGMRDPARALDLLRRQTRTGAEAGRVLTLALAFAGNRGQAAAMDQVLGDFGIPTAPTVALFYASDDASLPKIRTLERAVSAGVDTTWSSRAAVTFWHLWRNEPFSTPDARRYLATLDAQVGDLGATAFACVTAARLGEPDVQTRVGRTDSMVDWLTGGDQLGVSTLIAARCHDLAGDRAGALAMLARRPLDPVSGPRYLAGYLYEEGRLALLEGDRPRAVRAWRQFLVLRDDPDAALRPQVAMVRRVVDSLARN